MIPRLIDFLECSLPPHPSEQRKQGLQGKISSFTFFLMFFDCCSKGGGNKFEYNLVKEFKFSVLW
jgi:hypothetical protein